MNGYKYWATVQQERTQHRKNTQKAERASIISMEDFGASLEELRQTFRSGKTREESWRRSQLKGLLRLLQEKEDDIVMALKQDLGKHHVEAYRDEVTDTNS